MRTRWIHLTTAAAIEYPRFSLIGLEHVIEVGKGGGAIPPGPSLRGEAPGPHVTFMIEAEGGEVSAGDGISIVLIDYEGDMVHAGAPHASDWQETSPGYPWFSVGGMPVCGWPIRQPGRYAFQVAVNGQRLPGQADFYAGQPGDVVPAPSHVPSDEFALVWSHLVEWSELVPGSFALRRITDFLPARPGAPVEITGGYAAEIVGGPATGKRGRFTLEVRNQYGSLVRRLPETLIAFESGGPGHRNGALHKSRLPSISVLHPGPYEFVAILNGRRLGSSNLWSFP